MSDNKISVEVPGLEMLNKQLLWRLRERQRGEGTEATPKIVGKEWIHIQQKHFKNMNKNDEDFVIEPCSDYHDLLMISLSQPPSVTSVHVYICNTFYGTNER
jgi:hypothetical protein